MIGHVVVAGKLQKDAAKNQEGDRMLGREVKLCQAKVGEEGRQQEKERVKGRKQLKGRRRAGRGGKSKEKHDVGTGPTVLGWIQDTKASL